MTMTLEKIKGMNLQVGTPIEVIQNTNSALVYFVKIDHGEVIVSNRTLTEKSLGKDNEDFFQHTYLPQSIEDIKILEYKK